MPGRGVFGQQGDGIGQGGTQADAGQQAVNGKNGERIGPGGDEAAKAEQQYRPQQCRFAPQPVGQRPGQQGTDGQPEQGRAQGLAQLGFAQAPLLHQRRHDIGHGGQIVAIQKHHQKTQQQNQQLIRTKTGFVDQVLDIQGGGHG